MKIKDSVVWVTGGTSGIGLRIAEYLVEQGANVTISGRNAKKGAEIADRLGDRCVYQACDVTDFENIKTAAQAVVDRWGRMDVVCNFAGAPTVYKLFDENGEINANDGFRKDITVNLTGSYDVARVAAYHMKKNAPGELGERGCIVLCGSLASVSVNGNTLFGYKTAKEGIKGLVRCFAPALAPYGIRCNSVLPGWVLSGITTNPATNLGMNVEKDIPGQVFPGPIGTPQSIAMMVGQIIENVYINRTDISVDAGHISRY